MYINKSEIFNNKYFKNISWLFLEKILKLIVGLFIGVWVARYLGPDEFGLLSYVQSLIAIFLVFSTLGLDQIVVKELVEKKYSEEKVLSTTFLLKFIGSLILFIILFIVTFITSNSEYTNLLIFIAALSSIFQAFNVIDFYFQSKILSKYVVFSNIIMLLISSFIKIIFIQNEFSLIYFILLMVFDSFILAFCLIYFFKKSGKNIFSWNFNLKISIILLKNSWPLILSGLVIGIYMKVDQIMIKEMLGVYEVGQYAAAVKLSEALYFIPVVITKSLFPAIIKSKQLSDKVYTNRMCSLYFLLTRISFFIAIIISILSPYIIEISFGIDYKQAADVLIIHVWSLVIVSIGVIYNAWLINEGYSKKTFYRAFVGMSINIILNYILIPIYGINGAAIASLIGYICADIIYDFFDKDVRSVLKLKLRALLLINMEGKK